MRRASFFALGLAARVAGYAMLVFVVFASMFAGFRNFDIVSAIGSGDVVGVLLSYLAVVAGFVLVWLGRKAAPL